MKKLIIITVLCLAIAGVVNGVVESPDVTIPSVFLIDEAVEAGDQVVSSGRVEGLAKTEKDAMLTFTIPELGVKRQVAIREGQDVTKYIVADIPSDAEPGEYLVRITVSGDDFREVKHRFLIIE